MIPFARLETPFLKTATHLTVAGFLAVEDFLVVVVNLAGEVFDLRQIRSLQSSTQMGTMSFLPKRSKEVQPFCNRSTPTVTENSPRKSLIRKVSDVEAEDSSKAASFLAETATVTLSSLARSDHRSKSNQTSQVA
jgi:hypothetical protein